MATAAAAHPCSCQPVKFSPVCVCVQPTAFPNQLGSRFSVGAFLVRTHSRASAKKYTDVCGEEGFWSDLRECHIKSKQFIIRAQSNLMHLKVCISFVGTLMG
jgi:hypothetical protein